MRGTLRAFWLFADVLMALILVVMIGMVFTNVVLRYGFSSGIRESIELSRLCLVWLVMIGAAVVLRRNDHLAVHEVLHLLPSPIVLFLRRLAYVVVLVAIGMLFWGALRQTLANWNNISPLTGLPSGLFYLAGVVSSVLMIGIAAVRIIDPDARLDGGLDDDRYRAEGSE